MCGVLGNTLGYIEKNSMLARMHMWQHFFAKHVAAELMANMNLVIVEPSRLLEYLRLTPDCPCKAFRFWFKFVSRGVKAAFPTVVLYSFQV